MHEILLTQISRSSHSNIMLLWSYFWLVSRFLVHNLRARSALLFRWPSQIWIWCLIYHIAFRQHSSVVNQINLIVDDGRHEHSSFRLLNLLIVVILWLVWTIVHRITLLVLLLVLAVILPFVHFPRVQVLIVNPGVVVVFVKVRGVLLLYFLLSRRFGKVLPSCFLRGEFLGRRSILSEFHASCEHRICLNRRWHESLVRLVVDLHHLLKLLKLLLLDHHIIWHFGRCPYALEHSAIFASQIGALPNDGASLFARVLSKLCPRPFGGLFLWLYSSMSGSLFRNHSW